MVKKLFFALIVPVVFYSCNSSSAFKYSQDIVKKEQSLSQDISSTEDKIKIFLDKEQFDSIAAAGSRMENLVDAKLNEIKEQPAPDVKEAGNFKVASIKYFQFIKSMYTGYKDFGNASTAAREQEMSKLKHHFLEKTGAIAEMQRAQRKFAEANGFKLEGN